MKIPSNISKIIPKKYKLILKEINTKNISFEKFHGKTILTWCTKHCKHSKVCFHCPNKFNNFNKDKKKLIKSFKKGILVLMRLPSSETAGPEVAKKQLSTPSRKILDKILLKLKNNLKNKEYNRFVLLGAGPCKSSYCFNIPCAVLKGKKCKKPNLAHSSMEACGINVYKTVTNCKEIIYFITKYTKPEKVPYGLKVGLVLFE
jgi:predicted metal-binding protein